MLYYVNSEIAPRTIGEQGKPESVENVNHHSIMQYICMVDASMKMMWNKCGYYLLDYSKLHAIVLVTKSTKMDPAEDWAVQLVSQTFDLSKGTHAQLVPIISPLHDDSIPSYMP